MRLSDKIKPGQAVATSNIDGYEGKELAFFIGKSDEVQGRLIYIQWVSSRLEKVFTEDFDKTFYPVDITGLDEDSGKIIFKKKGVRYDR